MNPQGSYSSLVKMFGETAGFIIGTVIFAAYFPVFITWFIANAISMGIFAMLTDDQPSEKSRGGLWWIFPAIPTAVLIGGAIAWTVMIGSTVLGPVVSSN